MPVWLFEIEGVRVEKRLFLPARQNTVAVIYRLLEGPGSLGLHLRPAIHVRPHEGPVGTDLPPYTVSLTEDRFELASGGGFPTLRMYVKGPRTSFVFEPSERRSIEYAVEAARGYDSRGVLWSRGRFDVTLEPRVPVGLIASVEDWEILLALDPEELHECERDRRRSLLGRVEGEGPDDVADTLVLGADQFVISPVGRTVDAARARARGDSLRTIIAGYHWFTDWGRDTMISLEGLCLLTGRHREARWILRTFASYVRDGLVPNLFPEGSHEGLYHTADATLWFFHALDRYLAYTGDVAFLRELLPVLEEIVRRHVAGTRFNIHVDPNDGLLVQGEDGYALTWMDAKCDDWVVTPRRGKAVEINALWYNALVLMAGWQRTLERGDEADAVEERARRARASFNARFWYDQGGYLFDVVDGPEARADAALRPNQLIAFSLGNPVLDRARWRPVLDVVEGTLRDARGAAVPGAGKPGLPAELSRRSAHARRRVPPGDGVELAHRPVHRRRHADDPGGASGRARLAPRSHRARHEGLRRSGLRDLRRRAALRAARLHRASLGHGRAAARARSRLRRATRAGEPSRAGAVVSGPDCIDAHPRAFCAPGCAPTRQPPPSPPTKAKPAPWSVKIRSLGHLAPERLHHAARAPLLGNELARDEPPQALAEAAAACRGTP